MVCAGGCSFSTEMHPRTWPRSKWDQKSSLTSLVLVGAQLAQKHITPIKDNYIRYKWVFKLGDASDHSIFLILVPTTGLITSADVGLRQEARELLLKGPLYNFKYQKQSHFITIPSAGLELRSPKSEDDGLT